MSLDDDRLKLVEEVTEDLRRQLRGKRKLRPRIESLIVGQGKGVCPQCGKSGLLLYLRKEISGCTICLNLCLRILAILETASDEPKSKEMLLLAVKLQGVLELLERDRLIDS